MSRNADAPASKAADPALLAAARAARKQSYAPYSKFAVGAAIEDERGRIHAGCNVENAAYPQGWCAEASALAAMVLAGGTRVRRVAVAAAVSPAGVPVTPCGGCRQKLFEFARADTEVLSCGPRGGVLARRLLVDLLPQALARATSTGRDGPRRRAPPADRSTRTDGGPTPEPVTATLRQATRADIEAMHAVRLAVRENVLLSPSVTPAAYRAEIEDSGRGWVIEQSDGAIVGFAVGNARTGNIWALFVHPDHERQGHGRRLHDAMVEWLFAQGLAELDLSTEPGTRAEAFYERAGWRRAGRTRHGEVRFVLKAPAH